jgi:lysophospholipase L1-like esterase
MGAFIHKRRTTLVVASAIALLSALVGASVFILGVPSGDGNPFRPLRVAVVGDVYAAGSNNQVVWPTLLAQRTGWSVANFALPGAGFAADGQGGQGFTFQVDRATAADPQLILVVAGMGDSGYAGSGYVTQGAAVALNKIELTGVRALVVGPTWYEMPVPPEVSGVSDEIRKAADASGVPFLDALDPPWLTPMQMQPDFTVPNDQGQSVIADKIAAWLRTEVTE